MELGTERIRRKTYSCRTYGTKISITSAAACENGGMLSFGARLKSPWIQGAAVAVLVVALAIFTWIVPPHAVMLHNILHHLNILPFMLAGLRFGWRGALKALLLARRQARNEHRQECLDRLMRESHRLNKLLTNFLDFARPRLPRFQRTEPVSVIHSVMTVARHSAVLQDVKLEHDMPDHLHETE